VGDTPLEPRAVAAAAALLADYGLPTLLGSAAALAFSDAGGAGGMGEDHPGASPPIPLTPLLFGAVQVATSCAVRYSARHCERHQTRDELELSTFKKLYCLYVAHAALVLVVADAIQRFQQDSLNAFVDEAGKLINRLQRWLAGFGISLEGAAILEALKTSGSLRAELVVI
jgi:hypothetical protein